MEGLICIIHSVSSSTKIGEGLISIIHSVSPSSLGVGRGAFIFISITVYHPQVEMEDGLISIIHSDFPSTFSVASSIVCRLYRWGRGLFALPTKCIPQPNPHYQARGRHCG